MISYLLIRLLNQSGPVLEDLLQGTIVEVLQTILQVLLKNNTLIQQVIHLINLLWE